MVPFLVDQDVFSPFLCAGRNFNRRASIRRLSKVGVLSRYELREGSDRQKRGSTYDLPQQLNYTKLDWIDDDFEYQLNEAVLANLGSMDPDELVWKEVDTSSHIKVRLMRSRKVRSAHRPTSLTTPPITYAHTHVGMVLLCE